MFEIQVPILQFRVFFLSAFLVHLPWCVDEDVTLLLSIDGVEGLLSEDHAFPSAFGWVWHGFNLYHSWQSEEIKSLLRIIYRSDSIVFDGF